MQILERTSVFQRIDEALTEQKKNINVYGLPEGAVTSFFALLMNRSEPRLILTEDEAQSRELAEELARLDEQIPAPVVFPEWEIPPYRVYARSNETVWSRMNILEGLLSGEILTVIASPKSLMGTLIPREVFEQARFCLDTGQLMEVDDLLRQLVYLGYESAPMVESPGQFSRRGGIVDVFSLAHDHPFRVEFFDDEIDSLRFFDADSQRSLISGDRVTVIPARDVLLEERCGKRLSLALEKELNSCRLSLEELGLPDNVQKLSEDLAEDLEALRQGMYMESLDRWMEMYYGRQASIIDYFSQAPLVLADNINRITEIYDEELRIRKDNFEDYVKEGLTLPRQEKQLGSTEQLQTLLGQLQAVYFSALPRRQGRLSPDAIVDCNARGVPGYLGKSELMIEDLRSWLEQRRMIVIGTGQTARKELLEERLQQAQISWQSNLPDALPTRQEEGAVILLEERFGGSFELPDEQLVLLGEKEIFSTARKARRPARTIKKKKLGAFSQIDTGDYVVHGQYGIGRYLGITNIVTDDVKRDYLEIQYARDDKLFIPVDQMDLLERYVGSEGHAPRLSRLGTQDWEKVKRKVRGAVHDIAKQLLELYAQREMAKGFAFGEDTVWQKEFEDKFLFQETPDQLRAIEDTKRDMESMKPMDRIIVGDVGYGKTEVALRAAFKAVMSSRQVAVLVPTTVLATQHYGTFAQRFADWPIRIEVLNRFKSPAAQKEILKKVAEGDVDILIGTHRLLSKDVKFARLGLVVVDEEQKFGVTHKEKLKEMRHEVDFLTLTATPIPRTLHMSLSGARDLSVIETPPEDRHPVQTYVLEESEELVQSAIRRELARNGQVYYVHNRIGELDKTRRKLERLVPEARLAVAHGRMPLHHLEEAMLAFVEGQVDVLLCTTIVESGLDIGNVNTLIVDDADRLGLSQIYQLKGRIGRSSRMAYAYFTYRKDKILSQIAEKRLRAIREFTEFGSGFKIALRDLEIRGAGNLLGAEQHGHMLTVGFEMYSQLLEEEVGRLRGHEKPEPQERSGPQLNLNLQLNAFLPDSYISDNGVKMEFYKRIREARQITVLEDLTDEMIDRYGEPPREATHLIQFGQLKLLLEQLGSTGIQKKQNALQLLFSGSPFDAETLSSLGGVFGREVLFSAGQNLEVRFMRAGRSDEQMLSVLLKAVRLLAAGAQEPQKASAGAEALVN